MKILIFIFGILPITVLAQNFTISSKVSCNRDIICADNEVCKAQISFSAHHKYLMTGNIKLNSWGKEAQIVSIDSEGKVYVTINENLTFLGTVDLSQLNCSTQEKDQKILLIENMNPKFGIIERSHSDCRKTILMDSNGKEIWVKRGKYILEYNYQPLFESGINFVKCL